MRRLLAVLTPFALVAIGCATTPYRPYSGGRDGGYQERQVDDVTYTVTFLANHSSDYDTRKNLLLRCGEITFQRHYNYFTVLNLDGGDNEMTAVIKLRNDRGDDFAAAKTYRAANLAMCMHQGDGCACPQPVAAGFYRPATLTH